MSVAFLFNRAQPRPFRLHRHRKDVRLFDIPTSHGILLWLVFIFTVGRVCNPPKLVITSTVKLQA
jgi:hypothetical protein